MSDDVARSIDPEFPHLDPAVVAGYRGAPEHVNAEVIDGELFLMGRPRLAHLRAAGRLGADLDGPFDRGREGPGGWVILPEPELRVGPRPDIVIPDLAGWRRERLPVDFVDGAYASIAPDWVCEVLSPSTARVDRVKKLPLYHREKIGHAWILDPATQGLEVYRWTPEGWLLTGVFHGDEVVHAEPFDAVPLALAGLWVL